MSEKNANTNKESGILTFGVALGTYVIRDCCSTTPPSPFLQGCTEN